MTVIASQVTAQSVLAPVFIGLVFIGLCSLIREPERKQFSAIFVAGAGAAYLGGGFGPIELIFCAIVTVLAFVGLRLYWAIGLAWLLHSGWDVAHDLWGRPILPFAPNSSFGCFVCDPVIAVWYLAGAPSPLRVRRQPRITVQSPESARIRNFHR